MALSMRRIFSVLTVIAIMTAMLVASAIPAFAAAGDNANCVGQVCSTAAPGNNGPVISGYASDGLLVGSGYSEVAHSTKTVNCYTA